MRISLLHGEDREKAYEKFRGLVDQSKSRGFEIVVIDDIHKIVAQSLFEDKMVFVLEKPNKIKLNDWKWFSKNASKYNSNLLITFLDSFYPGNSRVTLHLLNDLVKIEAVELVFFLLSRHMRDLAWASFGKETIQLPSWRVSKLAQQAGKFEAEKLRRIIFALSEIDIKSKTSDSDLKSMLDIIIMKELE